MASDSWLDTTMDSHHCRVAGRGGRTATTEELVDALHWALGVQVGPADPSGGQQRAPGPAA